MIEHRDHLNHHIEEQMRRQNVEFSPALWRQHLARIEAVDRYMATCLESCLIVLCNMTLAYE